MDVSGFFGSMGPSVHNAHIEPDFFIQRFLCRSAPGFLLRPFDLHAVTFPSRRNRILPTYFFCPGDSMSITSAPRP
ncbi:hypothetical protein JMJ77_0007849 [Colletotrichum scovillei]|uniref:Uncharacterized protein n=1 Tax=Colletotrichum scovillei TaxID=1209932 RepID=A0A9P7UGB4_9PEZI|nr:hypothetical protein JMJ77_0007849 [Colletotrichum scovillei]KAG7074859.1 hypothetical protein JMJ76_0011327 [Colletotrichum scovillei]KAG7081774.1 hypothetical protein JMJ78_0003888 [Colletotrichum scovillei]